ncbi:MAG: hypothetical protein V4710_02220 [Verrucomicrobiota bacterium]
MAIRLNLYHEIAKEKQAKRRDPLKLSMIALGIIVAFLAGYYFWQLAIMSGITQEYERKQMEFKGVSPKAELAQKRIDELAVASKTNELLVKQIEGRFYWAPVLETIARLVPPELQITKLTGDAQGENVKKCNLSLDGISSGTDPRGSAEALRMALEKQFGSQFRAVSATFRTLEDGTETINVEGNPRSTAIFQILVQFATGEEAVATPPPRKAKAKTVSAED